ncbi:hypothetical protein NUSPORA_01020 [Nucleospora cyclopteri]
MLFQLHNMLVKYKKVSNQRAEILKENKDVKTYLSLINNFIQSKYFFKNKVTIDDLKDTQINSLIRNINEKQIF